MDTDVTVNSLVRTMREFLTLWIEQALYYYHVYDQRTYSQIRAFEIVVYRNRNPAVRQYLDLLVENIVDHLDSLKQVVCVIEDLSRTRVAEYVVEMANVVVPLPLGPTEIAIDGFGWAEIYTQLNLVMHNHVDQVKRVPQQLGLSFAVEVVLKEGLVTKGWTRVPSRPETVVAMAGEVTMKLWEFDVYQAKVKDDSTSSSKDAN